MCRVGAYVEIDCSLAFSLVFVQAAFAGTPKNVLILHEGSRLLPYQSLMSSELEKDLTSPKFEIQVFEEYLERMEAQSGFLGRCARGEVLGPKVRRRSCRRHPAFQLLVDRPPEFLRGTPVVFRRRWGLESSFLSPRQHHRRHDAYRLCSHDSPCDEAAARTAARLLHRERSWVRRPHQQGP